MINEILCGSPILLHAEGKIRFTLIRELRVHETIIIYWLHPNLYTLFQVILGKVEKYFSSKAAVFEMEKFMAKKNSLI